MLIVSVLKWYRLCGLDDISRYVVTTLIVTLAFTVYIKIIKVVILLECLLLYTQYNNVLFVNYLVCFLGVYKIMLSLQKRFVTI